MSSVKIYSEFSTQSSREANLGILSCLVLTGGALDSSEEYALAKKKEKPLFI
jgi:hypothetical protein